uniref:Innexin n=1 Tax=Elaeophora elaphi TaxID=1147741 RepID=A0A0R3RK83_9BILA
MFKIPFFGELLSRILHTCYLDDIVDRLHWNVTVIVLILCSLFVGAKQQFGQPIQCMLPAHFDQNSWSYYGQYYCFVQNTYRLTYNKTLPSACSRAKLHPDTDINYYQWVPFFLAIQALSFYIPGWLWTMLQSQRALDMKAVVREAMSLKSTFKFEGRVEKLTNLVNYIASGLRMKLNVNICRTKWYKLPLSKVNGLSLTLYLVSKLLNVVNNAVQLHIIGRFIGSNSLFWPLTNIPSTPSYFPLITFCDMERSTLGKSEINTLQCVLMLNFINQKIFFMLWYWISLLFFISLIDFIGTFVQCVQLHRRENLLKFYLQVILKSRQKDEMTDEEYFLLKDKGRLRICAIEFLGLDGALLLRFINDHAGIIVTRDISVGLWHYFCTFYQHSIQEFKSLKI